LLISFNGTPIIRMKPFDYYAPSILAEAMDILSTHNGTARVIAGGTDLLLKMKAGQLAPQVIVNIKRIPDLHGIDFNSALTLGALTTLEEIRCSHIIRQHFPALACAASTMASVQIRNLATVGGNLCNAAPSADLAPILIALKATVQIAGPNGKRMISLEDFFIGPGVSDLKRGELLVSIEVPPLNGSAIYMKCSPRRCMDIAVVGVGLSLRLNAGSCEEARIVLGAVAPTPLRARRAEAELIGGPLNPDRIDRAAKIAVEESKPIDDMRGTAWYRRQMIEVLTRRGLQHLIEM
jgi:aerobic carbon-monoxide dehydrogenase medium subunit